MDWNSSHKDPPKVNQKVYYFGEQIGIGIGEYYYQERQIGNTILCPHIFENTNFGLVDGCDAPYWLPYDEKRAKGWCPIPPKFNEAKLTRQEQEALIVASTELNALNMFEENHSATLRELLARLS